MSIWNHKEAIEATDGFSSNSWEGNNISIDTRSIKKNDIFVALKGENTDGHNYIEQALASGASVAIISQEINSSIATLKVKDTYKAIDRLATYRKNQVCATYIAITGSVGKTSTKEMLRCGFDAIGHAYASRGNYNNKLGLPISLASMPKNTNYGIFEIGMNHPGEITPLSKIINPDIAIITNIAPMHIENFESLKEIALAKAEIFDGMKEGSTAILNANTKYYLLLKKIATDKNLKIISCGKDADCEIIETCFIQDNITNVKARILNQTIEFKIKTHSQHLIENSIFVLAAGKSLGLDLNSIASGLYNFNELPGRGKKITVKKQNIVFNIIDDSYNAGPNSMKAAIDVLGKVKERKIAILSDMLELGDKSIEYHKNLKNIIIENNIDKIITYGNLMKELFNILPDEKKFYHSDNLENLMNFVDKNIKDGDTLLIKGSFGTKIHQLVDHLTNKETI